MPRIRILTLPGPRNQAAPFALIGDQLGDSMEDWAQGLREFAAKCGARGLLLADETIDLGPDSASACSHCTTMETWGGGNRWTRHSGKGDCAEAPPHGGTDALGNSSARTAP